jgi:hypothetical protein
MARLKYASKRVLVGMTHLRQTSNGVEAELQNKLDAYCMHQYRPFLQI